MRCKGIQFKVGGFLLVSIALVVGVLTWQSTRQTAALLERSHELSGAALREAARDQAHSLYLGLEAGLREFMVQGDMEAFSTLLIDLGKLEGVQEIGLARPDGGIAFSSDISKVDQLADGKMRSQALGRRNLVQGEDDHGLWAARAIHFEQNCAECHQGVKAGETAGILFVRSSLAKFLAVNQQMEAHYEQSVEQSLWTALATGAVGLIVVSVLIWWLIGRLIKRPLNNLSQMMSDLAVGRLSSRLSLEGECTEVRFMAEAVNGFAENLQRELIETLVKIGQGDLGAKVQPLDAEDEIRGALKDLIENLRALISGFQLSGQQIAAGSSRVASASESLSEGTVHQASSLEEMFSSIEQIGEQARHSSESAAMANDLLSQTWELARKGNDQMGEMVNAMAEIGEASQGVSRIIKSIDEIAFQTNLLALNAAVEAARAGTHGKGFAVVAQEVRNLAQRSARAAGETAELIAASVEKANTGGRVAGEMATALEEILDQVTRINALGEEIANSSRAQAQGISEVNEGAGQVDQVVQQNTAVSEQCAAASRELSGQAEHLKNMLMKFRLESDEREAGHEQAALLLSSNSRVLSGASRESSLLGAAFSSH